MIVTKPTHRQRGFTMIEMIGVLAVIAILASIVAPKIFDAIRDSKINTFASNIQAVETAVANYYKDTGALPSSGSDLVTNPGGTVKNWKGPYLDKSLDQLFSSLHPSNVVLVKELSSARGYSISGDGTNSYANKTNIVSLGFGNIDPADAKAVSGVIDGDANSTTLQWYKDGRIVQDTYTAAAPTAAKDLYAFIAAF